MDSPRRRIELSPPMLGAKEREYLDEALTLNQITAGGNHLDRFEREFAEYLGLPYAVGVSSGTAALHLAVRCLGLQPGDEVWCSTLTFAASAFPIAYERGFPVFVDCDPATWNISVELLAEELERAKRRDKLPRAVIVVDLFGQPADWDAIAGLSDRYGVPIIEDAAEALGARYRGGAVGSFGWANAFSFNGNKIVTSAGGGMLATRSRALAEMCRSLANQAREPVPHFEHARVGYNYRLGNLQAAIGLAQFEELSPRVEARRWVFQAYVEELEGEPGITFMPEADGCVASRWLTCVRIDAEAFGATAEAVRIHLAESGIESRAVWKPMHMQPAFRGCRALGGNEAEAISRTGLCLPSGSALTRSEIAWIADTLKGCLRA